MRNLGVEAHDEDKPLVSETLEGDSHRCGVRRLHTIVFLLLGSVAAVLGLASLHRSRDVVAHSLKGVVRLPGADEQPVPGEVPKRSKWSMRKRNRKPVEPKAIPNGKSFILDSVVGPIGTYFVSDVDMSEGNLDEHTLFDQSNEQLVKKQLIGKGSGAADLVPEACEHCSSINPVEKNVECCFEILSSGTVISSERVNLKDIPDLALEVTIGYERLLSKDLVEYVRSMPGVGAIQRAALCDEFRNKSIYQKKQLNAENRQAMLTEAGVKGEALEANMQSMAALATMPDEVEAQAKGEAEAKVLSTQEAEDLINGNREKASAYESQAKLEAQQNAAAAKAAADAAMKEVQAKAEQDLAKVSAKMAELELGSADLKGNDAELKAMVDKELSGATEITKGFKVSSWVLIQRNGIFGGRLFHQGVVQDPDEIKLDVVEFTADTLAMMPSPFTGTQWTEARVEGGGEYAGDTKIINEGFSTDYLASMVVRTSPQSSSEYSFETSSATDERSATRMYETYGSSASDYVQSEKSGGLSFGVPGVFSVGGGYADTESTSSASSHMGELDKTSQYSLTGNEYYKTAFYDEPRSLVMVPRRMLKATPAFENDTAAIYAARPSQEATDTIFRLYGTHVCTFVTLGGRWRISAQAYSAESSTYASLSNAASEAISSARAFGRSWGGDGGGNAGKLSMGIAGGAGSGEAEQAEDTSAGGTGQKSSTETRNVQVTVEQEWKGGQSGGTAAAWRASLAEDQNSNWKVLKRNFDDCIPVWAFFPAELQEKALEACIQWYNREITSSTDLDEEGQADLLEKVPQKCEEDPDSTDLGVLEEAFSKAIARDQERLAQEKVKGEEFGVAAAQFTPPTTCDGLTELSNMMPQTGVADAGPCADSTGLENCREICAERDACSGFWFYTTTKRCCPKKSWSYDFSKWMGGTSEGTFYACSNSAHKSAMVEITARARSQYGEWKDWEQCPRGFVTGIQQRAEREQGSGDDTGLNEIRLKCVDGRNIRSGYQKWGDDSTMESCSDGAYLVGYKLRSNPHENDDKAAIGIGGLCSNGVWLHPDAQEKFDSIKEWGKPAGIARCPPGYGIIGLRTRVEKDLGGGGDDTALNDVQMRCKKEEAQETQYIVAESGECGDLELTSAAECEQAAREFGLAWVRTETSPYYPARCYAYGPSSEKQYVVYYNEDATGRARDYYASTSICSKVRKTYSQTSGSGSSTRIYGSSNPSAVGSMYVLGDKGSPCEEQGMAPVLQSHCEEACRATDQGWKDYNPGTWSYSPNCFAVVSGTWNGFCHFNLAPYPRRKDYGNDNRPLCIGSGTPPPAPPPPPGVPPPPPSPPLPPPPAPSVPQYLEADKGKTCAMHGMVPVGEAHCEEACRATGNAWKGYNPGTWTYSPNCFAVVSGTWAGFCHYNTRRDPPRKDYGSDNRPLCTTR